MKIMQLAIRMLMRFRLYSVVNIIGLALSLTCVMIISRYVYREITVDHFIPNLDRICLVTQLLDGEIKPRLSYNFDTRTGVSTSGLLDNPAVAKIVPFSPYMDDYISVETQKYNARVIATDTSFLQILNYPIIQGDKLTPLKEPQSAVITQAFARKLFGTESPLGKTLLHSCGKMVTVTAVIGEPEFKSSIQFEMLLSCQLQKEWACIFHAAVLLIPGTDINALNQDLIIRAETNKVQSPYLLFPLRKFYFDKSIRLFSDAHLRGSYTNVLILSLVGFLVLIVGIFNFVNIYTVLMLKRAREFGMKKVFGANSSQIIKQLFCENMAMIATALFIAWVIIEVSKAGVESLLGIPQVSNFKFDFSLSIVILFILPLITSVYPFFKYNYATPISSLRSVAVGGNSVVSRTLFLVIQYVITFILIVVSIFFMKQLNFMLHADLGYRTKDIIKVQFVKYAASDHLLPMGEWFKLSMKTNQINDGIKERINASPLFSTWGYGDSPHEISGTGIRLKTPDGEFKETLWDSMSGKMLEIYDIQLKEGRFWNDSVDQAASYNFIINETAKKVFGIKDIKQALLQPETRLFWSASGDMSQNIPYQIVGVVKDFRISHLSKATAPLVISFSGGNFQSKLTATIVPGKKQEAIAFLKKLHEDMVGGEFEYSFVEDEVRAMYNDDKKVTYIYSLFAFIAILISAMGLFSLSLFDVQQRYREIALRKVNGATVKDVILLLLRKYYILLGVSFVIATLVSVMAINKYMEDFANRTTLSWWIFVVSALLTAVISLATLIFQIRKAANNNPTTILKGE